MEAIDFDVLVENYDPAYYRDTLRYRRRDLPMFPAEVVGEEGEVKLASGYDVEEIFHPDRRLQNNELEEAGFVVFELRGHRLCVVPPDSKHAHLYARLYAIVAANRDWSVNTGQGPRRVKRSMKKS